MQVKNILESRSPIIYVGSVVLNITYNFLIIQISNFFQNYTFLMLWQKELWYKDIFTCIP